MALESLLTTLKEYHPKRLVCLFGCGGNRSRDRRFEMGEVSGRLADLTIITSDNPRFEEPQAIIEDIKTGISKTDGRYVEIAVLAVFRHFHSLLVFYQLLFCLYTSQTDRIMLFFTIPYVFQDKR